MEKEATPLTTKGTITGVAERIGYGIAMGVLMKAVQKGWITADEAPYYATGVVTLVGGIWAWWINRPIGIAQAAASISDNTKVVTTSAIANATQETNIVSAETMKVTAK